MKVGDKIRVKRGKLSCSDFRPHQGEVGIIVRLFEGERYAIAVRFPNKDWGTITYHRGELEEIPCANTPPSPSCSAS